MVPSSELLLACILMSICFGLLEQAKPETVEKVGAIVKKQLALAEGQKVSGETKFSELGADSLDTVSSLVISLLI